MKTPRGAEVVAGDRGSPAKHLFLIGRVAGRRFDGRDDVEHGLDVVRGDEDGARRRTDSALRRAARQRGPDPRPPHGSPALKLDLSSVMQKQSLLSTASRALSPMPPVSLIRSSFSDGGANGGFACRPAPPGQTMERQACGHHVGTEPTAQSGSRRPVLKPPPKAIQTR